MDGAETVPIHGLTDFPNPGTVTNNEPPDINTDWEIVLGLIDGYLNEMTHVYTCPDIVEVSARTGSCDTGESLQDAQSKAYGNWCNPNGSECDDSLWDTGSAPSLGVEIITREFPSDDYGDDQHETTMHTKRFKLDACLDELPDHVDSIGDERFPTANQLAVYLKLDKHVDGDGGNAPPEPLTTDGKFREFDTTWTLVNLVNSDTYVSENYLADSLNMTSYVGTGNQEVRNYGWSFTGIPAPSEGGDCITVCWPDFTPPDTYPCECGVSLGVDSIIAQINGEGKLGDEATDGTVNVDIFKENDSDIVYSANVDCDQKSGETINGKISFSGYSEKPQFMSIEVTSEYDTKMLSVTVGEINLDDVISTSLISCVELTTGVPEPDTIPYEVLFTVKGLKGEETSVDFKVSFWADKPNDPCKFFKTDTQENISFKVKENMFELCCSDDMQNKQLGTAQAGNASADIHGGSPRDVPKAKKLDNNDIEMYFPHSDESYIINGNGFLPPMNYVMAGDNLEITDADGNKNIYDNTSDTTGGRITSRNSNGDTIVSYTYVDNKLDTIIDGQNSNNYLEYISNGTEITANTSQGYPRTYTLTTDTDGNVTSVGGAGGCSSCGGSENQYVYYAIAEESPGLIKQEKNRDGDIILYHYEYDSDLESESFGELLRIYYGDSESGSGDLFKEIILDGDVNDGWVVDTKNYVDANNYRVVREYKDSLERVIKRITFEEYNEDPDGPTGRQFIETRLYSESGNPEMTTIIKPMGDPDGTGVRRILTTTYGGTGGRKSEEKVQQYDSNPNNDPIVVEITNYETSFDNWHNRGIRKTTSTSYGQQTTYGYVVGDDTKPLQDRIMPAVSADTGISGTQQLKYHYLYDTNGRVEQQQQYTGTYSPTGYIIATHYVYDAQGNLIKQYSTTGSAPATELNITEYKYNGFNQQILMKSSDGVISGKAYDSTGKLVSEFVLADPDNFIWDPLSFNYTTHYSNMINNATQSSRFEPLSQTYYDYYTTTGRLKYVRKTKSNGVFNYWTSAETQTGCQWITTQYFYDDYGRRTDVIEDMGGENLQTSYQYDYQGDLKKTTLPDGKWTKITRDGRGLVTKEEIGTDTTTLSTTEYFYDDNGNMTEQILPDKTRVINEYDDFDRVKTVYKGLAPLPNAN